MSKGGRNRAGRQDKIKHTKAGNFIEGDCRIMVTQDAGLWHLSISCRDRLPTYDELKSARYKYLPDVHYAAQIFPPESEFVNFHEYCLHVWEMPDDVYSMRQTV